MTPYGIGAYLALCDAGLAKTAGVAGLAGALANMAIANEGRALAERSLGVEPPSWRRVSPLDLAVSEAELLGRDLGLTEPVEPATVALSFPSVAGLVSETAPAPLSRPAEKTPAPAVPAVPAVPAAIPPPPPPTPLSRVESTKS